MIVPIASTIAAVRREPRRVGGAQRPVRTAICVTAVGT